MPEGQIGFLANWLESAHIPALMVEKYSSAKPSASNTAACFVVAEEEALGAFLSGYASNCCTNGSKATANTVMIAPIEARERPLRVDSIVIAPENPRLASS